MSIYKNIIKKTTLTEGKQGRRKQENWGHTEKVEKEYNRNKNYIK